MILRPLLILFALAAALLALAAALPGAEPEWPTSVHRVVGLCYPGRVGDLEAEFKDRADIRLVSVDYEHAEATFAFDPKRVSAEQLYQQGGQHGFQIRARSPLPVDQLTRVDIAVAGLDCKGCALGTANVIDRIDGVYLATVDYRAGVVSTRIDPAKTSRAALIEALKKGNVTVKEEGGGEKK